MVNGNNIEKDIEAINRTLSHVAEDAKDFVLSLDGKKVREVRNQAGDELEAILQAKPIRMSIAAIISRGKTEVANIIRRYGRMHLSTENTTSPLLQSFYEDMATFGVPLQVHLMNDRDLRRLHAIQQYPNDPMTDDRSREEDAYVFCEVLTRQGLMSEKMKKWCQDYYHQRQKDIEDEFKVQLKSDLILLLTQPDINLGWERLRSRGRAMEVRDDAGKGKGISWEYYQGLHEEYQKFDKRLADPRIYGGPVLRLPPCPETKEEQSIKEEIYTVRALGEALKVMHGYPKI